MLYDLDLPSEFPQVTKPWVYLRVTHRAYEAICASVTHIKVKILKLVAVSRFNTLSIMLIDF